MANPVGDFLKYAATQHVRAYVRKEPDGTVVPVKSYERTEEEIAKKQELQAKQEKEVLYWEAWNKSGRTPQALKPLLKSFKPMIHSKIGYQALFAIILGIH